MNTTGLVRVTVAAPARRIDLALPERAPLAELLPALLRHAGENLADAGARAGGWVLRRPDGSVLEPARTLSAQRVRDGEVLHLTHAHTDWPELEYDDLVDAIATGSARTGATWGPRHTRAAGLALGALAVLLCLAAVLRSGPRWTGPAWWSIGLAAVLLSAALLLARAAGDTGATLDPVWARVAHRCLARGIELVPERRTVLPAEGPAFMRALLQPIQMSYYALRDESES